MAPIKRDGFKQLNFEIDEVMHKDIAVHAALYNMTIRRWILMALAERLEKEKKLGFQMNIDYIEDKPCVLGCACWGCLRVHRENGCDYGSPCGPDDFNNCCDCEKS